LNPNITCDNCSGDGFEIVIKKVVLKCKTCDHESELSNLLISKTINSELPRPHSEIQKLKKFIEVFDNLSSLFGGRVREEYLKEQLVSTGEYLEMGALEYIKKAVENGQIEYREPGVLVRVKLR
jgi:hypothetical protein